jgi:hypothetical protein
MAQSIWFEQVLSHLTREFPSTESPLFEVISLPCIGIRSVSEAISHKVKRQYR